MEFIVVLIVALGAAAMLWVGRCFQHVVGWSSNPYVARNLRYQPLALLIGFVAVIATQLLVPGHADFLDIGNWSAPAAGLGWLGVADGDSWLSVGLTFLVIMTVVTALVVWFQMGRGRGLTFASLARALPWAIVFSVTNAVAEELLFRLTVTEALAPVVPVTVVAACSAVLFGAPHWWGTPGRVPGVLLAGFMGWFLAVSVVQTAGLGWALVIHGAQDIVIICVLVASSRPVEAR
jgi:membrane protease YdiL (CAAX protease family)